MRHRGDGGNVGHLEGLRAGRLDQHRPGVRLEQVFDAGADQGIEIGGLDAIAGEHAVAEIARRPVDVVTDQKMIAGLEHREQGGGDRGKARRREPDAGALRAFQRHQHLLQRPGGRRAVAAVLELAAMGVQVFGGRIEHGGTVEDRRIDKTLLGLGVAARRHQSGFGLLRVGRSVVRRIHAFAATQRRFAAAATCRLKSRRRRVRAGFVNNRTQKTAVNPLTRLASRSVMRRNYPVAAR